VAEKLSDGNGNAIRWDNEIAETISLVAETPPIEIEVAGK
jgi:hypothetical protein